MDLQARLKATFLALVATLLGVLALAPPNASAADMLIWNDLEDEQIKTMPLDGSGLVTTLDTTPAVVIADPQSVSPGSLDYDPETGRLYWPNTGDPGNISWAAANGSGGGVLANVSSPLTPPLGLSLDGTTHTLYVSGGSGQSVGTMGLSGTQGTWALNDGNLRESVLADAQGGTLWVAGPEWVSYGNLNGSGSLDTYSPSAVLNSGFSVDRDAGRLYGTWYPGSGFDGELAWMKTDATTDGTLAPTAVDVIGASSTAIDHDTGSIYWANASPYGELAESRGIFRMPLTGGAGSAVGNAEIGGRSGGLIILKAPQTTSSPTISGGTTVGSTLSCSDVTWAGDRPEAHYFRSPSYKRIIWTYNGSWIDASLDKETTTADKPGVYQCVRSGQNAAGIGYAMSQEVVVTDPTPPPPPPDPVCPAVRIGVGVSKFTPTKPYGTKNTPGIRVTFKTRGSVVVRLRPQISFSYHSRNGSGNQSSQLLNEHQFTVRSRQRIRFILPNILRKEIARVRGGEVWLAPVTFKARATVWHPGNRECAQKRNLKLKTRVYYVSRVVGLRSLW